MTYSQRVTQRQKALGVSSTAIARNLNISRKTLYERFVKHNWKDGERIILRRLYGIE
jgi:DNA invertase Pin-like site-specific DNA recombinase